MEHINLEVGSDPHVRVSSVGGDLRISGRKAEQVDAKAPQGSALIARQDNHTIEVSSQSDCLLFLPLGAMLEVESVGGNLRVTNLQGDLKVERVGGHCRLRRLRQAGLHVVGGDLGVRGVAENLEVESVGGDASIQRVGGDVRIAMVGGDFQLGRVSGGIEVQVGSDAAVTLASSTDSPIAVQAGGDLSCQVALNLSAKLVTRAGGELHLPADVESEVTEEGVVLQLGEGGPRVDLRAGGDLWLQMGEKRRRSAYQANIGDEIAAQVEAEMANLEARFRSMDFGTHGFDPDLMEQRFQRAMSKAQRHAERAQARAKGKSKWKWDTVVSNWREAFEKGPSEEERIAILQMVENGRISVEEAEMLLNALEGKA